MTKFEGLTRESVSQLPNTDDQRETILGGICQLNERCEGGAKASAKRVVVNLATYR